MYNGIASLYSNSTACVKINNYKTSIFDTTSGVKQGDILSPTLFSMFINDLAMDVKNLNCGVDAGGINVSILLYADDIVLIAPNENCRQKQLNVVNDWYKQWRMVVNQDKSQIVHFRPPRHRVTDRNFTFGNHHLQTVNNYKYSGVMFDSFLTFSYNATILSNSARRAVGLLRFKLNHWNSAAGQRIHYYKLFASYLCPILDYCAGVWGLKTYDEVERVQLNALRYFLGVHKLAANDFVLGESGWVSCCGRHQLAPLRLWNRLISLSPDRLTAQIFAWDLSFSDTPGSLSNVVNQTLNDISQPHVFENLEICDLEQAHDSLLNDENNKWNASRYNKPKFTIL